MHCECLRKNTGCGFFWLIYVCIQIQIYPAISKETSGLQNVFWVMMVQMLLFTVSNEDFKFFSAYNRAMLLLLFIFNTDYSYLVFIFSILSVRNSFGCLHFLYRLWKSCGLTFFAPVVLWDILTELGCLKLLNMSL